MPMEPQTYDMRAQPHAPARRRERTRPLRVIIVEDSERILTHLAEELSAIDNVCIAGTAATEAQALHLLAQGHWDLAILDLQLKEGNGLHVLKAIREEARAVGTIAVFTNYAFPQYRKRSLELGADYFFDKSRELPQVVALAEDMAGPR
jgi:two-component system, OmpR family, response regulator